MRIFRLKNFLVLSAVILALFVCSEKVFAAALNFTPDSGNFKVGDSFSVSVVVESAESAMNAADGVIYFPADKLQVASVSKSGSIFNLWVLEPAFSNSQGTVSFEGVILNPGFTGRRGKIITISFKTRKEGTAELSFNSSSVLANDGQGTNILQSVGTAAFQIGVAAPRTTTDGVPPAPVVASPTHPDSEKWYSNSSPVFEWETSSGATAVRLLNDRLPTSVPSVVYSPPISTKTLPGISDGIWYFHAQERGAGGWGGITHFRYQVDTAKPEFFEMKEITRDDKTEPRIILELQARDRASGIDYIEIHVAGKTIRWKDDGSHRVTLPPLPPGKHIVLGKAVDGAGNFLADSIEVEVTPLEPPVFTDYPQTISSDRTLIIGGQSKYPGAQVRVSYGRSGERERTQNVRTASDGSFKLVVEGRLPEGVYTFRGVMVDSRGAESLPSDPISIAVEPTVFVKFMRIAKDYLAMLVLIVGLLVLLLLLIMYLIKKAVEFRRALGKETEEAEEAVRNAFSALQEEVENQIAMLDGKDDLSERERKVVKNLRSAMKTSEKYISKEIKDIEQVVRRKR